VTAPPAAPERRSLIFVVWAGLLCLALGLLGGLAPQAREWDGRFLDWAFKLHQRLGPMETRGPEVVIVGLDEASERAIPEPMVLYHRPLGLFMEAMAQAAPAAVGLDIVLPERSWDNVMPGVDGLLGRGLFRLSHATHLVLGMTAGNGFTRRPVHPFFVTMAGADSFAFTQVPEDPDRMVRRFDPPEETTGEVMPTLASELARPFLTVPPRPGFIHYALGRPFTYIPIAQVMDWLDKGRQDELRRHFTGRIVLLGSVIPYEDRFRLPVRLATWEDPSNLDSPGVLLQAQTVRTLLADATIQSPPRLHLVFMAGLAALIGLLLARRPVGGGILLVLTLMATAAGSYTLLDRAYYLPLTGLTVTAVLGYGSRLLWDLVRDRLRKQAMEKELAWARLLEGKNAELQASNTMLQEAQTRITELMATNGNLLEDLPTWASAMGREIQRTVSAQDLGIYSIQNGEVKALKEGESIELPEEAQIKAALQAGHRLGDALVVPAIGLSGELRGVLLVSGPFPDGSAERQLLQGFASQLGSALEMIQVRQRLVAAEGARAESMEELHARGIATVKVCPRCGLCYAHTSTHCAKDGAELEMPGILPLRILTRYQLVRKLGEGGMGTVYEATDLTLKRPVAIKLMRSDLFRDPRSRLRFERETRTLVQAQHPHVVTVYDSGELEDGSACLVMERLQGMDLGEVLANYGPGSPRQVARILLQAAEALDSAHRNRIIHRDLKPQNLFLIPSPDGFMAKILDFGLAKFSEGEAKVTQTGFMMGTPAYMAPEQVLGQDADERSDLYSFATVIYEILLGRPPLQRMKAAQILTSILNGVPTPPTDLAPWLPASVDAAFAQVLAKDPASRPGHILPWAKDLAAILNGVTAPEPGWPESFQGEPVPEGDPSAVTAAALPETAEMTIFGDGGAPAPGPA